MAYVRLPESVQTLYAELLDQVRTADAEAVLGGVRGSFVSKEIRGRTYLYLQKNGGATKQQIYLGRDTPELRAWIEKASSQRADVKSDENHRRDLVAMLAAGATSGTIVMISTQPFSQQNVFVSLQNPEPQNGYPVVWSPTTGTIDQVPAPEPATVLAWTTVIAAVAVGHRFRRTHKPIAA